METNIKTVLVVEDEPALGEAISFKMKGYGINALLVKTAEEALASIKSGQLPDLLWIDILLPGMNGLEFLEKLRADEKTKNIPAFIVSASHGEEKIKRAEELNVTEYIVKSQVPLGEIVKKVASVLNNK